MRRSSLHRLALAAFGFTVACAPDDAKNAPPEAKPEPVLAVPEPNDPPAESPPVAAEPPPIGETTMHPIAVARGGLNDFAAFGGHLFLDLAGRPIPIGTSGQPDVRKSLLDGLGKRTFGVHIEAIATDADGTPAFMTMWDEVGRGYPRLQVFQHDGKRWRNKTRSKGPLVAHYSHFVRVGDTTFGLRAHHVDPAPRVKFSRYIFEGGFTNDKAEARSNAFLQRARAALLEHPPAFEVVAGPEAPLPVLPAGTRLKDVVSTEDGTIFALTDPPSDSGEPVRVLQWTAGTTDATPHPLPDIPEGAEQRGFRMSVTGSRVAVSGELRADGKSSPYVALGTAEAWEPVALLEQIESLSDNGTFSAPPIALDPRGELRVISNEGLWARTPEGVWTRVVLPAIQTEDLVPTRKGADLSPWSIAWGSGAWWATGVDMEQLYDIERTSIEVVYTSAAESELVELPRKESFERG